MSKYRSLPPSGIGEAAKYNFSPWFIKIRFDDQSLMEGRNWSDANTPISTLQTTIGNEYEEKIYDQLESLAYEVDDSWYDWSDNRKNVEKLTNYVKSTAKRDGGGPTVLEQARLKGSIGRFEISGDADLILLYPSSDETVHIQVIDIKSSWDEKPSQQLQAATYSLLVNKCLSSTSCSVDYTVGAGIFYRESDVNNLSQKETAPSFNSKTREGDVKRVLKDDGPFVRAFEKDFKDLPLTLDRNSPYAEVSTVEALESSDLALLGLSPGEKQKLESEGIQSIQDLAELYTRIEDAKPFEYREPEIEEPNREKIQRLKENYRLSERLPLLVQRAQSVLGKINPESEYAHDKPWSPWIIGSGSGNLPEDDPPYETELPVKRGGMIRVYLNIQYDHVRDSITAISGRVTSGVYDSEPLTFSRVSDDFERDSETWKSDRERRLIENASSDMFNAIELLANISGLSPNIVPHIYLYSQTEYDAIYEATQRHRGSSDKISMMRYLLDKREGIDQKMVSIVQDDIRQRMALNEYDISLQNIIDSIYPNTDEVEFEDEDWVMKTENNEEVDLSEAFEFQMFDTFNPVKYEDDGVSILNDYGNDYEPDTFYRPVPRDGAQIPIEYLWASEDVGILNEDWAEKSSQKGIIRNFMWVDSDSQQQRIKSSMFESMSRILTKCLHFVERGITYKNTDIEKKKITVSNIAKESEEETSLSESCKEYLDFESKATEDDAVDTYSMPLERRIVEGKSVPIRVTNISREEPYMFEVQAETIYDEFDFQNPNRIASSSELSGSDGTSSGSRCVATPIINKKEGYEAAVDSPKQIASSTKISVDDFDAESGKITIRGYRQSQKSEYEYVRYRQPWTLDPSEPRKQYVGPGETFVLDPNPDNTMADKSLKALRHTDKNPVYDDITAMRYRNRIRKNSMFDSESAQDYIDWCSPALEFTPNNKQEKFITEDSKYSLLQGPPGTGKTSGALAHSVLARAYDMEKHDARLTGLVTGLSNKSVDEVLSDVAELKQRYDKQFDEHPLSNVRLVRLSYDKPRNTPSCVEYRNYQIDEDKKILSDIFVDYNDNSQQQQLSSVNAPNEHTILFSTPGRIESLAGKIEEDMSSEEVYKRGDDMFDFVAIDEASMMPIYQFLMVCHFTDDYAQLMLAGDHRQLPPVRQHDWEEERRKSIIDNLPHMSVLDYFRYIRGDGVEEVYDASPSSPDVSVPIVRLSRTYRCHKDVTEFLRQTVYSMDNIKYNSRQDDSIPNVNSENDVVDEILESESSLTLVLHNDRTSQQVSIPESNIVSRTLASIPEGQSVGVVTPHNAQKGRLRMRCDKGLVDTVERFQGGEKDIMLLSTTVSDPSHLSDEEDFILSLNRLNVALSRMKKKLVVIVPESVFELVPDEKDTYDEAIMWKSLYSAVEADTEPDMRASVSDINPTTSYGDVELEIHHLD